jgi:hypothetical protein
LAGSLTFILLSIFGAAEQFCMKRRIFVKLAVAATAGLYLPGAACNSKNNSLTNMLSQPNALQHICDVETIREIGKGYQNLVPGENKESLIRLLSPNIGHEIDESRDSSLVSSVLEKRVQQDFQENKTMVVDGWVLSVTEARQCALFSLSQN